MKSSWFFLVLAFVGSEYILLGFFTFKLLFFLTILLLLLAIICFLFFNFILLWGGAAATSAPGGFSAVFPLQWYLQVEKPK